MKRILIGTYLPAGHFCDRVLSRVGRFPVREEEDDHRDVIVEVAPFSGAHLQQLRVWHLVLLGRALERDLDEVPRDLLQSRANPESNDFKSNPLDLFFPLALTAPFLVNSEAEKAVFVQPDGVRAFRVAHFPQSGPVRKSST